MVMQGLLGVTPDTIEIKKSDPRVRKHVIYKEAKIK